MRLTATHSGATMVHYEPAHAASIAGREQALVAFWALDRAPGHR
jgi:hypothetical protein